MVKRKSKEKELEIPLWILDGFVGILALMIYNFILYFLATLGVGGIVLKMQAAMGYFGINYFLKVGISTDLMIFGALVIFCVSFALGISVGSKVRKNKESK